jgi:histidinol-phosphatase (PHP family)
VARGNAVYSVGKERTVDGWWSEPKQHCDGRAGNAGEGDQRDEDQGLYQSPGGIIRRAMLIDYHVHTNFSADCRASMQEQCEAALSAGVQQIAFTEHEEYHPEEVRPGYFNHPAYMLELERCRRLFEGRLVIRAGIEVSEPHRYAAQSQPVLHAYPWDFVLGSLHWLDVNTSALAPEFFTSRGDWRESFRAYFREMLNMVRFGDFDVIAHFDYPARYGRRYFGDDYDIREYEPEIRPVLRAAIERGKGIEINTGSLRKGMANTCPAQPVVDWYRELGGTLLSVGSDSHRAQDVGAGIPLAIQMARTAGFTHLAVYERRVPTRVSIWV